MNNDESISESISSIDWHALLEIADQHAHIAELAIMSEDNPFKQYINVEGPQHGD